MELIIEYKINQIDGKATLHIPDNVGNSEKYRNDMYAFTDVLWKLNDNLRRSGAQVISRRLESDDIR